MKISHLIQNCIWPAVLCHSLAATTTVPTFWSSMLHSIEVEIVTTMLSTITYTNIGPNGSWASRLVTTTSLFFSNGDQVFTTVITSRVLDVTTVITPIWTRTTSGYTIKTINLGEKPTEQITADRPPASPIASSPTTPILTLSPNPTSNPRSSLPTSGPATPGSSVTRPSASSTQTLPVATDINQDPRNGSSKTPVIVGAVLGALLVLIVAGIAVWFVLRRRKRNSDQSNSSTWKNAANIWKSRGSTQKGTNSTVAEVPLTQISKTVPFVTVPYETVPYEIAPKLDRQSGAHDSGRVVSHGSHAYGSSTTRVASDPRSFDDYAQGYGTPRPESRPDSRNYRGSAQGSFREGRYSKGYYQPRPPSVPPVAPSRPPRPETIASSLLSEMGKQTSTDFAEYMEESRKKEDDRVQQESQKEAERQERAWRKEEARKEEERKEKERLRQERQREIERQRAEEERRLIRQRQDREWAEEMRQSREAHRREDWDHQSAQVPALRIVKEPKKPYEPTVSEYETMYADSSDDSLPLSEQANRPKLDDLAKAMDNRNQIFRPDEDESDEDTKKRVRLRTLHNLEGGTRTASSVYSHGPNSIFFDSRFA